MKAERATITSGLDQLFFSPLIEDESLQDRANAIESFLNQNGWTWDDYLFGEEACTNLEH